jgi:hypothetical protein
LEPTNGRSQRSKTTPALAGRASSIVRAWIDRPSLRFASAVAAIGLGLGIFVAADELGATHLFPAPWDKLAHFLYYGAIAGLAAHGLGRRWFWAGLLVVPALGALDEWRQIYIRGRDASVFDWLADLLGTIAFVYLYFRAVVLPARAIRQAPNRPFTRAGS